MSAETLVEFIELLAKCPQKGKKPFYWYIHRKTWISLRSIVEKYAEMEIKVRSGSKTDQSDSSEAKYSGCQSRQVAIRSCVCGQASYLPQRDANPHVMGLS